MSSKRTNKSRRGKRMSKTHTKTDNVDGSEVFVLPPQLLQKLGINLNQVHETGENLLTDLSNVNLQDNDSTVNKSVVKKSNTLNENECSMTESSMLETADLMKKSVFLSPTFVPEISATGLINAEVEFSCFHHTENKNEEIILKQSTTSIETEQISKEHGRKEKSCASESIHKNDNNSTAMDIETTSNVICVNTLLPGNSKKVNKYEKSQKNTSIIRKTNEDSIKPNKVVKSLALSKGPVLSEIKEHSQDNQIITKCTNTNYVSCHVDSIDVKSKQIKTNENLCITDVIDTDYNVNSENNKKASPLDGVQSDSTDRNTTTTATLCYTLNNDNNFSHASDTGTITNLASVNYSLNENKVDHINTASDDHVDEAYLSDSGNSNLGIADTNSQIDMQSSVFVDKTVPDINKKITVLSEETLDSSKFNELMKNPLFSPRRENIFPVCVNDIVTLCHKYYPLGIFDNGINMIDDVENNQLNLNVGNNLLQDTPQNEIKSNNVDTNTPEDSFPMVKFIENETEVQNAIDLMVENDKYIEHVKNIVIEFIDETSIKSILGDEVLSAETPSTNNDLNQENFMGYKQCSDTKVLPNSQIVENKKQDKFFNSVPSESKCMPIEMPCLYESKQDITASKMPAENKIKNAFHKNVDTNIFYENNIIQSESISVLKIENNESVDKDLSNDMNRHADGLMENAINKDLVFNDNVVKNLNVEVPLKLTDSSNMETIDVEKYSGVQNQQCNEENTPNEISQSASDRISEIAAYLEKYAHILINRRKSSSHGKLKGICKNIKNNVIISKLNKDGVEKPGGSSIQNSEHVDRVQNKTFKTYRRSKKMPKPIIIYTNPSSTDNMLYEIHSADEHRNVMLQSHDNYCLCSDFGSLSFYDTQKAYQHIHFQNKTSSICNTNIFSMEQDYIKYIENRLDELELVTDETTDEKCDSICWKTYEVANAECDRLTEYYKCLLGKDTENDIKSSKCGELDYDIKELSVAKNVDKVHFEKTDTLKNIDLHNKTIDLAHIEEKSKAVLQDKSKENHLTKEVDCEKSQKVEIYVSMIIKNHKITTVSQCVNEDISENISQRASSAEPPNVKIKTNKKKNCDIKIESHNTDVILPEKTNKQIDLSLEQSKEEAVLHLLGAITCPQDECNEKVENIGMKRKISPVIHSTSNKNVEYDKLTCGVCKSILGAEQWNDHISKEHCFITWKDGDILDLNSDDLINNLNNKLISDKILKCTFCEIKVESVKRFILHVQKCLEKHMRTLNPGPNSEKLRKVDEDSCVPEKHIQSQVHIVFKENNSHTEESKQIILPSNVTQSTNSNMNKEHNIISGKLFQKQNNNNANLSSNSGDLKHFELQMPSSNTQIIVEKKSASGKSLPDCSKSTKNKKSQGLNKVINLNDTIKNPHKIIVEKSFNNIHKTCKNEWKAETITKSISVNNEKPSTLNYFLEKSGPYNKTSVCKDIDSDSDDEPLIKRRRISKTLDHHIEKSEKVISVEKPVKKQGRPRKIVNIVDNEQKKDEVYVSEMTVKKQGRTRKSKDIIHDEADIVESAEVHSSEMIVKKQGRTRKSKDVVHFEADIEKSNDVHGSEITVNKKGLTKKSTDIVQHAADIVESTDVHSSEMTVKKQDHIKKSEDMVRDEANKLESTDVHSSNMTVKKRGRPRKIRDISHDKSIVNERKIHNNLDHKLDGAQESLVLNSKKTEDSYSKEKKKIKKKKIKEVFKDDQMVECGVCNTQVLASNWIVHIKKEHNYLAWKTGEPKIDLTDSKEVHTHLLTICSSIDGLECAKCGLVRRYPKVFLQHTEKCEGPTFDVNLFAPNLKLDNSKTNTDHSKLSQASDMLNSLDKVICAVCSIEVSANSWKDHAYNNHYNIAWRVGDIPINVRNPYAAEKYLKEYKAVHRNLVCNVCRASRASYSGFYAHILTCGKTEEEVEKFKEVCEECNQKYLCIYRQQHLMVHREKELSLERKKLALEQSLLQQQNKKEAESEPSGRRKAAVKAESVIENYKDGNLDYKCESCDYASNNKKELKRHKCGDLTHNEDGSDVSVAFQSESESEESQIDSDLSANEEEKEADIQKRKHHKSVRIHGLKMPFKVRDPKSYMKKAGHDFVNYHYTDDTLFGDWKNSECELVPDEDLECYIPSLKESCKVKIENETDWITFKRFEARNETVTSLFAGGTPQCVSWAPPLRHKSQDGGDNYLAIACHREGDQPRYACDESYQHPALLQLWDFGQFGKTIPKLVLGLALDNGAIWGLDWCPSGTRDLPGQGSRLGLLAVAFSNGMAFIYAVPYPSSLPNTEKPFYKLKPVAELRLYSKEKLKNIQCASICWSAQKGHETVIAGYSDGTVAYYNLVFDSPLCYSEENGVAIFYPNHDEKQHNTCVTGISTFASKEPARWGLVSSASATGARLGPVRARCSAAAAPLAPHWPSALLAGHAAVINELDYFGGSRRLGFSRYITSCLHCGIAAHSNPPLIRKLNAHPAFPEPNKVNLMCVDMKPLSSSSSRKRKNNTPFEMILEPFTYETAVEKYGLEIMPVRKNDGFAVSNIALDIRPERFPLNDVNSMAFCTSAVHHQKLAAATHSGIVIVFHVS